MRIIGRVLPVLLLAGWTAAPAGAQTPGEGPPVGFIEVSGTGLVQVAPDRVRVSFAVETQAASAAEASTQNARLMETAVSAVRALGVRDLTVETFGYALRPDYALPASDPSRGRVISGYTAVNNIRVLAGDVQAVGRIIDAAIQGGANRVSSLAFEATDTEAARREALSQAVAQARSEAETIALALGRTLGEALEVRGGAQAPSPRPEMAMAGALYRSAETPIEAGDLNVTASVSIRFALGGPRERH